MTTRRRIGRTTPTKGEPSEDARAAGLRHVTDQRPGIARWRNGRGFVYRRPDGRRVTDRVTLSRIRSLAVPPAWTDVWICPDPRGHLQATGRDARGRKQYRYHPAWRAERDRAKFDRLATFGRRLPRIRRRVDADLRRRGLPRERVLALVVRLLELTLVRVGNDEYARLYRTFGLTTMHDRHALVEGGRVIFRFRGKRARRHEVTIHDRRLARLVARCRDLPGQDLFQYVDDDGVVRDIASDDVNAYLREVSGDDFTAKDVRTWVGTMLAFRALGGLETKDGTAARRAVSDAVAGVAARLGNTPAVCRASYVHPAVVDAYLDGSIGRARIEAIGDGAPVSLLGTAAEERALVRLLEGRIRRRPRHDTSGMAARPRRPRAA
jgi:DNA topoisomerase-1